MLAYQKTRRIFTLLTILLGIQIIVAQDITTVQAKDTEISDNLNLEAVASIFGESKDLEDFEKQLNNPDKQISNLDLNNDQEVDYLRVVEEKEEDTHLILIQAVIGKDLYQDVATIEVEKDKEGKTVVQVVGDVYMYGPDYIIEPVYVRPPVIFSIFWHPFYQPYRSLFYWGYYPRYYHPWHPFHTHVYRRNVHVQINVHHHYNRVRVRRSHRAIHIHAKHRRNDFGRKYPSRAYTVRKQHRQIHNAKQANRRSKAAKRNEIKKRKKVKSYRKSKKEKGKKRKKAKRNAKKRK
jgi:hypothetical protein